MRTYITPIYIIIWEFLLLRLVCKCVKIVLKWGKYLVDWKKSRTFAAEIKG